MAFAGTILTALWRPGYTRPTGIVDNGAFARGALPAQVAFA